MRRSAFDVTVLVLGLLALASGALAQLSAGRGVVTLG